MEGQIKKGVEALEFILRGVMRGAERTARGRIEGRDGMAQKDTDGPEWEDYWYALLDVVSPGEETSEGEDHKPPFVENNTTATFKGIVHTTMTQPYTCASSPPTPSETVLAVGAGAQLFPNKGGPYHDSHSPLIASSTAAVQVARETMDEVEEAVEAAGGVVDNVVDGAVKMREDVEGADERFTKREGEERHRKGWKSSVFDI